MGAKGKVRLSVDEIVATIQRSSLPALVIEGDDDVILFRPLEEICEEIGLSVFPAGGRRCVLDVFARLRGQEAFGRTMFFADRDFWLYSSVPAENVDERLVLTTGFSIENDVYVDGDLEKFLSASELTDFRIELEKFISWYALTLRRHQYTQSEQFKAHPNVVLDNQATFEEALSLRDGEVYPTDLKSDLLLNYQDQLRGKSLLALLVRQLARAGRPAKHNTRSLIETVAIKRGARLNEVFQKIALGLGSEVNI